MTKRQLIESLSDIGDEEIIPRERAEKLASKMTGITFRPIEDLRFESRTLRWNTDTQQSIGNMAADAMRNDIPRGALEHYDQFILDTSQHDFDKKPVLSINGVLLDVKMPVRVYAHARRDRYGIGLHYTLYAGGVYGVIYGDMTLHPHVNETSYGVLKSIAMKDET